MIVARIEWPDDLNEAEREIVPRLDDRIRRIVASIPATRHAAADAFEALDRELFSFAASGSSAATFGGRLRIVTDIISTFPSSLSGPPQIRVRLAWIAHERARRDAEARARAASAEQTRRREERRRAAPDASHPAIRISANVDHLVPIGELRRQFGLTNPFAATPSGTGRVISLAGRPDGTGDTIAMLEDGSRHTVRDPGLGGVAVGDVVEIWSDGIRPRRRDDGREFRREVLGEFVPPAGRHPFGALPASDISALQSAGVAVRGASAALGRPAGGMRDIGPRPFAQLIAQQLPHSLEEVLRGVVIRRSAGDRPAVSAPGNDEAALEVIVADRRPGDEFYFVPRFELTAVPAPPLFKMDTVPGAIEERIASARRARERQAVDLLVRIVNVALAARERAYAAAAAFYVIARACLEPWSRNPALLELEAGGAAAAAEAPAEDPIAARFALLELD